MQGEQTGQTMTTSQWLDQLERAIADEHSALASSQAERLMDAVQRKERAAAALDQLSESERSSLDEERLAQMQAANQANAALMQVAYMHAQWALQQLGRLDNQSTYSADGNSQPATITQYIGTA